jgi:hypothetical protein
VSLEAPNPRGGSVGSANNFYLAYDTEGQVDPTAVERNRETQALKWASTTQASDLISLTTYSGRERDLRTLHAAFDEYRSIASDKP